MSIDYTQAAPGNGADGPPDPDNWKPWKNRNGAMSRETIRQMAANRYIDQRGGLIAGDRPHIFTVWHWRSGDPTHANGRPKAVHTITFHASKP